MPDPITMPVRDKNAEDARRFALRIRGRQLLAERRRKQVQTGFRTGLPIAQPTPGQGPTSTPPSPSFASRAARFASTGEIPGFTPFVRGAVEQLKENITPRFGESEEERFVRERERREHPRKGGVAEALGRGIFEPVPLESEAIQGPLGVLSALPPTHAAPSFFEAVQAASAAGSAATKGAGQAAKAVGPTVQRLATEEAGAVGKGAKLTPAQKKVLDAAMAKRGAEKGDIGDSGYVRFEMAGAKTRMVAVPKEEVDSVLASLSITKPTPPTKPVAIPAQGGVKAGIGEAAESVKNEPWQMTQLEFSRSPQLRADRRVLDWSVKHRQAIEEAVAQGKPVPGEVLAEYPDFFPARMVPGAKSAAAKGGTEPAVPAGQARAPQAPVAQPAKAVSPLEGGLPLPGETETAFILRGMRDARKSANELGIALNETSQRAHYRKVYRAQIAGGKPPVISEGPTEGRQQAEVPPATPPVGRAVKAKAVAPPSAPAQPPAPPSVPPSGAAGLPAAGGAPGRKGALLQATPAEELGKDYKVKDVLREARSLDAKKVSLANQMQSRTKTALRDLGRLDRNGHMQDIPGSPSIYDVAENPTAYQLTAQQKGGLAKLGQVVADVKAERETFGVAPNEIEMLDEGHFLPRTVLKTQGVELKPRGGGGTALRGGGKERGRRVGVGEVAEAEAKGVVYAHPMVSVDNYVNRWLKAASDTHIRDLLVPFSETSSIRVPAGLRARVEGLRKSVTSLRQTAEKLSAREDAALQTFLEADDPSVDALRDILDNITVGANAVGKVGRNFGKNHAQVKKEIQRMRGELTELAPEWRAAKEAAQSPRPGRQTVPMDVAPALAGRDFEPDVMEAITRYYGARGPARTQTQRVFNALQKAANVPIRFFNATMDTSALLRQQATGAVVNPRGYVRDVAKGFKDVVTSREYDLMVGSEAGQYAASRGVAVFGNASEIAEFSAAHWMHQIPAVGKVIGWADNHFIRFNTRRRIELFHLERYRLERELGESLSPAQEEAIARAVNRATGVSTSRGGDLETGALFASRYTRASIEEVIKAASNGQIEGEIARRYIGHLVGATTFMVAAVALAQKRNLEDVLNPLDVHALKRGELSLNPNFLSVRLYGHDVKPMGAYDSLARLMFVAGDSMVQAIREKDARELGNFFSYAASTKGSPLVSFGADLIRGRTFNGEDPMSLPALVKRVLPFTGQNVLSDIQRDTPAAQAVVGGALESVGLKTATMSRTELRDVRLHNLYGPDIQKTIDGLNDRGIRLGFVGKSFDMMLGKKGGEIDLTFEQRDALQSLTEDVVFGGLQSLWADPAFLKLPEQQQTERIKSRITELRAVARDRYRATLSRQASQGGTQPRTAPPSPAPVTPRAPIGGAMSDAMKAALEKKRRELQAVP